MNKVTSFPTDPWISLGERLLASTAIKIELRPSQYLMMLQRRAAIEKHLQRDDSPLKGRIRLFYPQGSVAIGATIRAKFRDEGFDIDIIVELDIPEPTPAQALDLLYEAVRGEPGSKHYDRTERQTRCVTVHYEDGMHIDLSPSVLLDQNDPRLSHIFHAKPREPESDTPILMNSFAFAEYYNRRCPIDQTFADAYAREAKASDALFEVAKKQAKSVLPPDHSTDVGGKSAVTVALQLIKRNRNLRWHSRNRRMPASVMLSCLALEAAQPGCSIGQNLLTISQHILDRLLNAKQNGRLIVVRNPRCEGDIFTDRWPKDDHDQNLMIEDMRQLLHQIKVLLNENASFKDRTKVLEEMFGEAVGREVRDEFATKYGDLIRSATNRIGVGGGVLAPTVAQPATKSNTFYGGEWPRNQNH